MSAHASRTRAGVPSRSLRVFFALWPDAAARERLAALAAAVAHERGGRAVAAANLHVTLAFVGSVAAGRVDALCDAGEGAARPAHAIDVSLERLGGAHDGELVWLAPRSVPAELLALHERLDAELRNRSFPVEPRAFRPHVTLARRCVRRGARAAVEPIAWRATRVALMVSATLAGGSEYRELAAWRLGASGD
jgi:2'-5' RNA ligase